MTRILALTTTASIASLALAWSVALASPQIPTPVNPYPDEPVATDGSPLPRQNVRGAWSADAFGLLTGRSVFVAPRR